MGVQIQGSIGRRVFGSDGYNSLVIDACLGVNINVVATIRCYGERTLVALWGIVERDIEVGAVVTDIRAMATGFESVRG